MNGTVHMIYTTPNSTITHSTFMHFKILRSPILWLYIPWFYMMLQLRAYTFTCSIRYFTWFIRCTINLTMYTLCKRAHKRKSFTISTISPYLHDALPYLILQIPSHVLKFLNFNFLLKCYSDHDTQIVSTTCSLFTLIFDVLE